MSRPHVTHLLTDFMDENLAWQPTEKVKAHLAFCNGCRQALNSLKRGIALLGATPEATPSGDLERRILDWMSVERSTPAEGTWSAPALPTFSRRSAAIAAGVLLAGMMLAKLGLRDHADGPLIAPPAPVTAPKEPEPKKPKSDKVLKASLSAAAVKAAEAKARAEVQPAPMEGNRSAIGDELTRVVDSESAWRELWMRHNARAERVPPLPAVDFTKNQVVALFAGQKPTGGYKFQILGMSEAPWNGKPARVVQYRLQSPPKNVITTQVVTEPFLFRVVPRFDGPTFFEKNP